MNIDQVAFDEGVREATSAITNKKCRLFWQTRDHWGELFTDLMKERFGVQVVHIDCFTSAAKYSYESGYNQTVTAHINATFGEGAFERAWEEIEKYRLESYQQWRESNPV